MIEKPFLETSSRRGRSPRWWSRATLFATSLALTTAACGGASPFAEPKAVPGGMPAPEMAEEAVAYAGEGRSDVVADVPAPVPGMPAGSSAATTQPLQKIAPMLIYTAIFQMAVFETTKALGDVEALALQLGGYLVQRDDASITVRVPAAQYRAALDGIGKLGDVLHRRENAEDVTNQYFDLEARLRNARALRDRLENLLQQAKDVKDALAVQQELARVTGEIESFEGKLKRMRELVNFSTITVRFAPKATSHVEPKVRLPFPWLDRLGLSHLRDL